MKMRQHSWICSLVGIGFILTSCAWFQGKGSKTESPAAIESYTTTQHGDEPEVTFAGFSILQAASTSGVSPYLATPEGDLSKGTCFSAAPQYPVWQTENPEIIQKLSEHTAEIEKAILAWAREAFLPVYITGAMELRAGFEEIVINHTPLEGLRLSPEQNCIEDARCSFPANSRTITTQFGARKITFKSEKMLDPKDLKAIRTAAETSGFQLTAQRFDYPKAMGPDGNRLKDEKDRPLFLGPEGEKINWSEIPKPKKRPVLGWSLQLETPLYFAVGDLIPGSWASEADPDKCSLNLVFSDPTPRVPDCPELNVAGFGVEKSTLFDAVTVKVTADGITETRQVQFGKRQAIQLGGRVIVWVEPTSLEEGAKLTIDSFVIDPGSTPPPEEWAQ